QKGQRHSFVVAADVERGSIKWKPLTLNERVVELGAAEGKNMRDTTALSSALRDVPDLVGDHDGTDDDCLPDLVGLVMARRSNAAKGADGQIVRSAAQLPAVKAMNTHPAPPADTAARVFRPR
ncbi:MAG: hypothetical protein AAF556_04615, partial [Pseudomonadota bacterium]